MPLWSCCARTDDREGRGASWAHDAADRYWAKRDPQRTPARGSLFVIQEHRARSLHWEFRLERTVCSFHGRPKGLPMQRRVGYLAVQVEDHPLEYGKSRDASRITSTVPARHDLDRGIYECDKWSEDNVKVWLHGTRVEGHYGHSGPTATIG